MILWFVLIGVLALWGIGFRSKGFFDDYIGVQQCNAIKGLFILVVFVRHIYPYIIGSGCDMSGRLDGLGLRLDGMIGQLLVVMFLFYSGYGVMESIKRKGSCYVRDIPKHRVLTTMLNFGVAVAAFVLLNFALGIEGPWDEILLAFTGWTSVGNSNWYIFVIVLCYLLTYFAFRKNADNVHNYAMGGVILLALSFVALLALWRTRPVWWYDTLLCYPAGVLFSIHKDCIECMVKRRYWLSVAVMLAVFLLLYNIHRDFAEIRYNMLSVTTALLVVLVTMKVRIDNVALVWLGKNLFPLYIYQRIPMIALATVCGGVIPREYSVVYFAASLAVVVGIAFCYKHVQIKLK